MSSLFLFVNYYGRQMAKLKIADPMPGLCSKMNRRRFLCLLLISLFAGSFLFYFFDSGPRFDEAAEQKQQALPTLECPEAPAIAAPPPPPPPSPLKSPSRKIQSRDDAGTLFEYDQDSPLIFIGGVPRSGTTLMRAMLDAHGEVRCGEETRVVPRMLQMRAQWLKSPKESVRLEEAGISTKVLNSAISSFILEVVAGHGEPSKRLCNKDPFTLRSGTYLRQLFPKSKFLFMVRDGRATVHSIITRKVTITGFDLKSYRQCLTKWNAAISAMEDQCNELGEEGCLRVHYEQLVLHPRKMMRKILSFLELPWDESVLHHEQMVGKEHGISLSKVERSSDQVVKPVNLEALSKWVGNIPDDVVKEMAEVAPMLAHFGYDPHANPPSYGQPDSEVIKNTNDILANEQKWEQVGEQVKKLSKTQQEIMNVEARKNKSPVNIRGINPESINVVVREAP